MEKFHIESLQSKLYARSSLDQKRARRDRKIVGYNNVLCPCIWDFHSNRINPKVMENIFFSLWAYELLGMNSQSWDGVL